MVAAASSRAASGSFLSIGQVLARLSPEFPDLSGSKLRYLEVQGIVTPSRTPKGYRKFSPADIERLRTALLLQRDQYLPLTVIRDYLDQSDAGLTPAMPVLQTIHPSTRHYTRDELIRAAGARPRLLDDAIRAGLLTAAESYGSSALQMLTALVDLDRYGIEPRHVRSLRPSVERDVALVEAVLNPLLRRSDASSRAQAAELAPELFSRLNDVRAQLSAAALAKILMI